MAENLQVPPMVTISTERLQLTTLQMSDLDDIMPMITNFEVMKWTSRPPVENFDQARTWLSARALGPGVFNFAIREHTFSTDAEQASSKVIGLLGAVHPPTCGYMINPAYAGKGYATEALRAFIPAYFARVSPASEGGTGHDILDAFTATMNYGSHRVLEKCGFVKCETLLQDFDSWHFGSGDSFVWRIPRLGKTLEELGLAPDAGTEDDEGFVPPVQ